MGMQLVILAISTLSTTHPPEVMNVKAINTLSPSSRAASLPFSSITEIFLNSGVTAYVQSPYWSLLHQEINGLHDKQLHNVKLGRHCTGLNYHLWWSYQPEVSEGVEHSFLCHLSLGRIFYLSICKKFKLHLIRLWTSSAQGRSYLPLGFDLQSYIFTSFWFAVTLLTSSILSHRLKTNIRLSDTQNVRELCTDWNA